MMPRRFAGLALAALMGSTTLTGCVAFPHNIDVRPSGEQVTHNQDKRWAYLPPITQVPSNAGMSVRRVLPLPLTVGDERLEFKLSAKATLAEMASALAMQGTQIVLKVPEDIASKTIALPVFSGTLRQFLEKLCIAHDLNYEFVGGMVVVSPGVRYMVSVPQYEDLMKRLPAGLEGVGAKNVKADLDTGLLTFEASLAASADAQLFLQRMANNASMVTLQVAVIDVRLNRDLGRGFDWNEFSAKWGSLVNSEGGSTGGALPEAIGDAVGAVTNRALGKLATVGATGLGLRFEGDKFSLTTAIKMLSQYGKAQTDQDVLISTLSGAPVKINSGSQIPYVSNIGAVAAQGGAVSGSVNTSTVDSGIDINIVPHYDESDRLVLTNVKTKLSSLVRFRELNAGNSVGTISQPEIQKLEFENISRLRPGEVIMLGGITYDQASENYTSLAGLESTKAGSKSVTTNRHAIFIVIRPSVTVFKRDGLTRSPDGSAKSMFSGDVAVLLDYLAASNGKSFQTLGTNTPIEISLTIGSRSEKDILEDVIAQINGRGASITHSNELIQLQYGRGHVR